jgi:hypothetical protein
MTYEELTQPNVIAQILHSAQRPAIASAASSEPSAASNQNVDTPLPGAQAQDVINPDVETRPIKVIQTTIPLYNPQLELQNEIANAGQINAALDSPAGTAYFQISTPTDSTRFSTCLQENISKYPRKE